MQRKRTRKLSLQVETVRSLPLAEVQEIAGGSLRQNEKGWATWGIYCWTRDSCFGSCIC